MVDRSAVLPLVSGGLSATVGEVADMATGAIPGWEVNDLGYIVPTVANPSYPNATLVGAPDTGSGGGSVGILGGDDAGNGAGAASLTGGASITSGVNAGAVQVSGGSADTGDANGGHVYLNPGPGHGSGVGGQVIISLQTGSIIDIEGAVSTPGVATGTLTNAPKAGNAQTWLSVTINGVAHWMPAWHA